MSSRAAGKKSAPKARPAPKAAKAAPKKKASGGLLGRLKSLVSGGKKPAARKAPPKKAAPRPAARKKAPAKAAARASRKGPPHRPAAAQKAPVSRPPPLPVQKKPVLPPPLPSRPPPPKVPTFARSYYFADLRVGDDLPPLARPALDRVQIVKYAGASGDWNRLHVDEVYAQALGFRGAFAPGPLALGFMAQLLTGWLKKGQVRRLAGRFVKLVWPGDELTCRGRIAELRKEKGVCSADIELWAENQKGELVLRGQATCELVEAPPAGSGGFLSSLGPGARPLPPARPPVLPPRKK